MVMLIITATITGSVLAADYVFNPKASALEEYPVVYFDGANGKLTSNHGIKDSTNSANAFKSMTDAINAIVLSDSEA